MKFTKVSESLRDPVSTRPLIRPAPGKMHLKEQGQKSFDKENTFKGTVSKEF